MLCFIKYIIDIIDIFEINYTLLNHHYEGCKYFFSFLNYTNYFSDLIFDIVHTYPPVINLNMCLNTTKIFKKC